MRLNWPTLFLCLILVGGSVPGYPLDDKHFLLKADAYLAEGAYLEAIGTYRAMRELSSDPEIQALSLLKTGNIYALLLKDYPRALEEYVLVIKGYERSEHAAQAMISSGIIQHEMGRNLEAREQFRLYLNKHPAGEQRELASFMLDLIQRGEVPSGREEPFIRPAVNEMIRVLIGRESRRVTISSQGALRVTDREDRNIIANLAVLSLDSREDGLYLGGKRIPGDRVAVNNEGRALLQVNGRSYRGRLIVKKGAGGLELINELPLEWYLYGVVPREMPSRWPLEALKAQAVAARTYAIYLKERADNQDYHLCATTMSQVYHGAGFETEATNRAVDETSRELLYFRGRPVLAYFHAHSGGITEDPKNVWFAQLPYLKGVADSFSMKAPSSAWSATLDYETIRRSLNRAGIELGAIEGIAPLEISPSGRVTSLKVVHERGESVLSGNEFRLRIDPKLIRSTLFVLTDTGGAVTIEGRGYGHGVGMSQWGAQVMALEGYSYREVLKYYYPEVEIR